MATHAQLANLTRRFNRKIIVIAFGVLIALVVIAHGVGAAYSPANSNPTQAQSVLGSSTAGDAGTTTSAGDAPIFTPNVDDLTGNTVVYDDGTGAQMDYVPAFDPAS